MRFPRKPLIYTKVEQPAEVRVLVPYTKPTPLLQTVVDALRIQYVQPELVKVDEDAAYWRMLKDAWAEGREFFVVEQDVLVWQGAIARLQACTQDWCTLPTLCRGRFVTTTFGCVKFGQQLVERNPGIWDGIDTDWHFLDAHFAEEMGWPFIKPHPHNPVASHINEVQWPKEISLRAADRRGGWYLEEAGGGSVLYVGNKQGGVLL